MTLLGPVLLLVLVLLLLAARCLRRLADPSIAGHARRMWTRTGAAVLTGLLTLLVYGVGALSGFTRSATICAIRAGKGPSQQPSSITESLFPLSKECHWTDGTSVDLVPTWLNALLWAGLAGVVLYSALAVRAALELQKESAHER
ncbi:hypothetical protein [Streptomyces sp. BV129]|uniref:hypothetical protein n=1 Tax=Streptomyces sp. BV129 TaxID=2849671 RepID=UPI001C2F0D9A|nr:hypothetical protein [Streptomyces sp. BV129]MBV1949512.1 hypothetical protein [Streptomyces sp. BV129]